MAEGTRAVLWDMDGTLLRSTQQHWLAWRETLATAGFDLTVERFAESFGRSDGESLRLYLGADLSTAETQRLCAIKDARYIELVNFYGVSLLPGVGHWLARLKSEAWRQAVASSAKLSVIKWVLARLKITSCFDAVVSVEDVQRGKPDPQIFLLAAAKLGVSPTRCIVIEDAPAGIEAARQAGMRSIGVLTTHSTLMKADLTVQTLQELPADTFDRLLHI